MASAGRYAASGGKRGPTSQNAGGWPFDLEDLMAPDKPFPHNKSKSEWLRLLSVRQPAMRRQALLALGQIAAPVRELLPSLIKALNDNNELVRRQAAESL